MKRIRRDVVWSQRRDDDWAWARRLRSGDVLRKGKGLRIVRRASARYVTFVIQRCSWTRRATTTYATRELARLGYRPTGHRMALRTPFDRRIEREARCDRFPRITCCDVRGAP